MRRSLLLLLVLAGAFPAPAAAQRDHTAQSGAVSATLSGAHLTITRGGQLLFDGVLCAEGCRPGRPQRWSPLVVTDLDGDGEPEVSASLYTGGAHCCYVEHTFRLAGAAYAQSTHNFADPGAVVRDVDRDGRAELVSADARVATAILRFMRLPYAASAEPLQVWRLRSGRLVDATRRYRRQLRTDARTWWAGYARYRGSGRPVLGMLGAWAADQYQLGRRRHALRILRRERRRGHLRQVDWYTGRNLGGKRYVRKLDRTLRRHGYGIAARRARSASTS